MDGHSRVLHRGGCPSLHCRLGISSQRDSQLLGMCKVSAVWYRTLLQLMWRNLAGTHGVWQPGEKGVWIALMRHKRLSSPRGNLNLDIGTRVYYIRVIRWEEFNELIWVISQCHMQSYLQYLRCLHGDPAVARALLGCQNCLVTGCCLKMDSVFSGSLQVISKAELFGHCVRRPLRIWHQPQ